MRMYRCIQERRCYDAICTHNKALNTTSGYCQSKNRRRGRRRDRHEQRRSRRRDWSDRKHLQAAFVDSAWTGSPLHRPVFYGGPKWQLLTSVIRNNDISNLNKCQLTVWLAIRIWGVTLWHCVRGPTFPRVPQYGSWAAVDRPIEYLRRSWRQCSPGTEKRVIMHFCVVSVSLLSQKWPCQSNLMWVVWAYACGVRGLHVGQHQGAPSSKKTGLPFDVDPRSFLRPLRRAWIWVTGEFVLLSVSLLCSVLASRTP